MRLDRFLSHHEKQLQTAESTWSRQKAVALAGRTLGLLSGFDCNGFLCAGGYWFRKPWFRDAFESIYFNFPLFHEYRKRLLKNCITIGLRAQENALTPILLGSGEKCFDATLLCLLSSLKYLEYEEDELLFEKTRQKLSQLIESLSSEGAERSVKLLENGLVSCQANYSWIDSKIVAEGGKAISSRIPASWNPDSQRFLLIEVNALWVKLLREAEKALPSEERERISQLKALAEGGFRKVFLSQEFPPQIVSEDCLMKSSGLNSPAIEALSLVGDLAPPGYLENALEQIQPSLVNRSGKLFGIQTINEGPEVFHGDPEYHRRVVWPRESVHLINFLKLLGKKELVEEILLSNLEHSAEEGAVFYSQELFALPSGNNNRPSPNSGNPVPVKNPIQLWSQFVYPYFEFLES
jgi:glycogen debranching enzyme